MSEPSRWSTQRRSWTVAGCAALLAANGARSAEVAPGASILQDLRSFNTTGTVLHIAAHPDDENTQLITYFARARGYRTAYLSLTRGDGGQNEIGPEFDEKLGVARTQELLAARRIDGGQQFFTRAIDFGYSKSAEETLRFWDRQQVLGDVVRVIRTFRPDVIVTRFSPTGGGTHGHHTASGILGPEAFKLAGDPSAYPEQLAEGLKPWQPKRVVLNSGGSGRGGRGGASAGSAVRLDIGGTDPATGEGLGAIAGRSRAQHRTQGFGNFGGRGGDGSGPNEQSFLPLGGEPATKDLFDGIDTTWNRYGTAGAVVGRLATQAIAEFKGEDPAASVPTLLALHAKLAALPVDALIEDRRAQLGRILQACLRLTATATAEQPEVVPGEKITWQLTAAVASQVPVRWLATRLRTREISDAPVDLKRAQAQTVRVSETVPADAPLTQPYWLRQEGAAGIYRVEDPRLIGRAENAPAFPVEFVFLVMGEKIVVPVEGEGVERTAKGELRRRVDVVSPVVLRFAADVALFAPGATKPMVVEVTAIRPGAEGKVAVDVPAGWKIDPAAQAFRISPAGGKVEFSFAVTAPAQPGVSRVAVHAAMNGQRYANDRSEIRYDHIPPQILQPPARGRLVVLDVATRGKTVGYLPGAGDDTAKAIAQLGYTVQTLTGADLTAERLRGLDAVVIGVRAFNERDDLESHLPGLFAYVEQGGNVIAQYNRPSRSGAMRLGPYPLSIQGSAPDLRVTDERAPVTFLAPEHPILNTPNRIGPADFEGWVQERGAYFPSSWDEAHYATVLAMSDPGEAPLRSSVLVARYGKGCYVYTGLAFFRQLPAGVPGSYRLLANLLALGK